MRYWIQVGPRFNPNADMVFVATPRVPLGQNTLIAPGSSPYATISCDCLLQLDDDPGVIRERSFSRLVPDRNRRHAVSELRCHEDVIVLVRLLRVAHEVGSYRSAEWNPALFEEMLPYTLQSFEHLDRRLKNEKESFSGRLASVAAHLPGDPWHHAGWLFVFVKTVDADARSRWALHFGSFLEGLSEERLAAIWNTWLRDYWTDRTTGVPLPLDPNERHGMMMWLVPLQPHFDEALPLIALTAPEKADPYIFYKIGQSNLPTEHPIDTGRLLVSVLKTAVEAEYSCEAILNTALKTATAGAAVDDVAAIVEHLSRLRCEDAAKKLKAAMQ